MRWRRVDPVQQVDALLLTGVTAEQDLTVALEGKREFLRYLPRAIGADWAAVFADTLSSDGDKLLPNIPGALPLYEADDGWWFPVGTQLDVPDRMRAQILAHFSGHLDLTPPLIVVPRFGESAIADSTTSDDVDVYRVVLRQRAGAS